jgi:aminopeptidase N
MVEAYPFQWGGMENQTMTMVHRQWVLYGDDNGISHEMSHQWWGDHVTCLDWRNIWLNEGFATNSADLYTWHRSGLSAFRSSIDNEAQEYFNLRQGRLGTAHAPLCRR